MHMKRMFFNYMTAGTLTLGGLSTVIGSMAGIFSSNIEPDQKVKQYNEAKLTYTSEYYLFSLEKIHNNPAVFDPVKRRADSLHQIITRLESEGIAKAIEADDVTTRQIESQNLRNGIIGFLVGLSSYALGGYSLIGTTRRKYGIRRPEGEE